MMLWPRTLLWRSVLLIALLLIAAHVVWLQIFQAWELEPRARRIAEQIVSVVNLTRAALITAQPGKRLDLLRDLSNQEGIRIYIADPGEAVEPLPDRRLVRLIAQEVRRGLGPDTKFMTTRGGMRGVWVSFKIDDDEYWMMMPRGRIERPTPLRWIYWGMFVLALALAGAYLIVARINQPLRALTRAAEQMGRGTTPAPVAESGPAEIRTLAHAFNQMAADLKRLDEERALLLAGVSHDLRTPLSRIRLGVEMLGDKADSSLRDGMIQDIEDIDAVINQFLDFARVGDGEPSVAGADLNALVSAACDRFARNGNTVATRLAPLPKMALKPRAMQRLIANLIDNALRHGGGEVEVRTGMRDNVVTVAVLDRGPGIPAAEAERMLHPFTRLDAARSVSGAGLGLAIVERIARIHNGSISLLAREGGGLEARLELPLAPKTA